ncbi:hypothetical protein [Paenibacillus sp. GCM10023250]|uniref:hypothetical protein n=1 Tax=Paenibacillus sp. GCM10023250 TaxID=3252648 RepID=UPI003618B1D1
MTGSRALRWTTGVCELLLAIPLLSAVIIIGTSYAPLFIMFVLHLIALGLSIQNREAKYGSVMGLITCVLGWIPFLGWLLHLVTGILLLVSAAKRER